MTTWSDFPYLSNEIIDRAANKIWPLDNLSDEESRDELRRDTALALEAVLPEILAAHRKDLNDVAVACDLIGLQRTWSVRP